jgi:acyl-homoserine-lactone acylase
MVRDMSRRRLVLSLTALTLAAAGTVPAAVATSQRGAPTTSLRSAGHKYSVTIRRTAGGIPHITASNFGSLGYGVGFAFATDDICTMADDLATVEGKRSLYFGPDNTYTSYSAGVTLNNLDSDIYWRGVAKSGLIKRELAVKHGPAAITPTLRKLLHGYVAGYNRYLDDVGGAAGITDPACKGKPWVHPMTMKDEYLRIDQLTELASAYVVIDSIAEAAPPTGPTQPAGTPTRSQVAAMTGRLAHGGIGSSGMGSNAIAIGKDGNRDRKHGLFLGTPHFPWLGTERLYEMQLTVPGHMNVEGAGLYGVPLVLVGHTADLAWSHTVSTAYRFVPIQLALGSTPTSYVVDGKTYQMKAQTVSVNTGSGTVTHTLYSTRYGPIFDNLQGQDLAWDSSEAFALFDANYANTRLLQHFFAVDEAQSVPQLLKILRTDEGLPWVNTIAADRAGHAMYADIGSIPNVPNHEVTKCSTPLGQLTFQLVGLPVLDGSRSACAPETSPKAAAPGIFPPDELPSLVRSDYVTNSNDSYWLSNPAHPLTGFARIIGDEEAARSLRTRIGLLMTERRLAGTDGEGKPGFDSRLMRKLEFSDIQYGATLAKTATTKMCRSFPGGMAPTTSGTPVAVGTACDVLAKWNGRENGDARGAVLWRAFWERALGVGSTMWKHPFKVLQPVTTPNTLDTTNSDIRKAFGDALVEMNADGLPFNVKLGTVQYVVRHGQHIALHGGPGDPDGEFNAIDQDVFSPARDGVDPSDPTIGSSYIQVTTWLSHQRCPDVHTILTYSESANPHSPYYEDQTKLFSAKKWVREVFCAKAVKHAAISKRHLTG